MIKPTDVYIRQNSQIRNEIEEKLASLSDKIEDYTAIINEMKVFKPITGNTFLVPEKGDFTLKLMKSRGRTWEIYVEGESHYGRLHDAPWIVRLHALPYLDKLVQLVVESNHEVLNYLKEHGV